MLVGRGGNRASGPEPRAGRPATHWVAAEGRRRAGAPELKPYGHTFGVSTDSLRAALDATVLSPAGRAVGVDDQGRVVGVTSYQRLRRRGGGGRPGGGSGRGGSRGGRAGCGNLAHRDGLTAMDWSQVPTLTWESAKLGILPALFGLIISVPLGIVCVR